VAHDRLLTNQARCRRNLTQDPSCQSCSLSDESVLHVLRDCRFAQEVWKAGGWNCSTDQIWQSPLTEWLQWFLNRDRQLLFGITCWYLWKARNERVFDNINTSALVVAQKAEAWSSVVSLALERDSTWLEAQGPKTATDITWQPGPSGWVTLNTDGAVNRNTNKATAGGLIRTEEGRLLKAFTSNLGRCSITRAEIRGALTSLQLDWDAGHRRVLLQMDSKVAIALLQDPLQVTHQHSLEVLQFRNLLARDWVVDIRHIYREGNQAADYLAGIGFNLSLGFHEILISDCNLNYFARLDSLGIATARMINNTS
ncbi:Putative ribonuclease H protein At1g65750, partial [Linum perenne]